MSDIVDRALELTADPSLPSFWLSAPKVIADLVAEVERLEDLTRAQNDYNAQMTDERDTARAEVERLRPRQIETPTQLAALPRLTVIRINPDPDDDPDDDESPVLEKRGLQGWYETGRTGPLSGDRVAEMLPATLLWTPKDGAL